MKRRRLLYLTLSLVSLLALSATKGGDRLRRDLGLPQIWQHTSSSTANWDRSLDGYGFGQQAVEQASNDGFYHSDVIDSTFSSDGDFIHVSFYDGTSVSSW